MMEGTLRGKFREGRGKKLVERNQWQLFDPSSPRAIYSAENWETFPGMKITMAMIIPQSDDQMVCPQLNCSSKSYTDSLGGGKIWYAYSLRKASIVVLTSVAPNARRGLIASQNPRPRRSRKSLTACNTPETLPKMSPLGLWKTVCRYETTLHWILSSKLMKTTFGS